MVARRGSGGLAACVLGAWAMAACATGGAGGDEGGDGTATPDGGVSGTSGGTGRTDASAPPVPPPYCESCSTSCAAGLVCATMPTGDHACVPSCDANGGCPSPFACAADDAGARLCFPLHGVCCAGSAPTRGPEACDNGFDDDCDGLVDCLDPDCEGKGCGANGVTCAAQVCRCPSSTELCNDKDDDCDGVVDDGCPATVTPGAGTAGPDFGGTGGGPYDAPCPAGTVLVGFDGRSGSGVDALAAVCAEVVLELAPGTPEGTYRVRTRNPAVLAATGGGGGGPFSDRCPDDQVVVGIVGRNGTEVDQFGFTCGTATVTRQTGGAWGAAVASTVTSTARGGTGGAPFTYACPAGNVGVGIVGRSGVRIDRVALRCGPLGLTLR